jgi:16S rRNA (cytosine967-C5)-methyltransferase
MTYESLLGHASEIMRIIRKSPQPADRLMSEFLRAKRYIGARERRAISGWVFSCLRVLHQAIELSSDADADALQASLMIDHADRAEIQAAIEHATGTPLTAHSSPLTAHSSPLTANVQSWILDSTRTRWPQDADDVWRAMTASAPVVLRVNLRHADRASVIAVLRANGIACREGAHAPAAIVLEGRVNITESALYRDGIVEVQDEGSQMIALGCDVHEGDHILDACAGAGGKTLHLADLLRDRGRIVARDIEWARLKELTPRARRAGLTCVHVQHTRDADNEQFDVVLVDAPCSGLGTARRSPMVKWRLTPELAQRHARKQFKVLTDNAPYVRDGGVLVYATCSVLPQENEEVVRAFLQQHADFTLEAEQQMDPYHHGTDGLYWARLRRAS